MDFSTVDTIYTLEIDYLYCLGDTIKEKCYYIADKVNTLLKWMKELVDDASDCFVVENKDTFIVAGLTEYDPDLFPKTNLKFLGKMNNLWGEEICSVYLSDLIDKNQIHVFVKSNSGKIKQSVVKIINKSY